MNTQVILMEVISKSNKLLNTFKTNGLIIDGVTKLPIMSETAVSQKTGNPGIYFASIKWPENQKDWDNIVLDIKIVEDVNGVIEDTFLEFKYSPYSERPYVDYVERLYLETATQKKK